MRIYLKGDLERAFELAWDLLPQDVREELRELVVSVRSAETLNGVRVRCSDGSYFASNQEGNAWFACEGTGENLRGFLILNNHLQNEPEPNIIATILHELSHGLSYVQKGYEATQVQECRSELSAWLQAGAWASNGRSEDSWSVQVVGLCIAAAKQEFSRWLREFVAGPEKGLS